jgi:hypothetical protein
MNPALGQWDHFMVEKLSPGINPSQGMVIRGIPD